MPCGTNRPVSFRRSWSMYHARHADSPPSCLPDYPVRPAAYDGEVSGRCSTCETSCQRHVRPWEWRMCLTLHGGETDRYREAGAYLEERLNAGSKPQRVQDTRQAGMARIGEKTRC
jgi:hypothetical protein